MKRMLKMFAFLTLVAGVLSAGVLVASAQAEPNPAPTSTQTAQIHILAENYMDAIVLESTDENGEPIFGIVDSGQGDDWPDGSDARYPDRPGITKWGSIKEEMVDYLNQLGVTNENLEFYLGTHVHSDHIGTAAFLIQKYQPKRVYAQPYRDELINNTARLWDNLYQYDQLRKAASQAGATFIQYFDTSAEVDPVRDPEVPEKPTKTTTLDGITIEAYTANPAFELGDMELQVMHYFNVDKAPASSMRDANSLSLGVKVTSKTTGMNAFLSGDIDNYVSSYAPASNAEEKLASQVGKVDFLKLGHHGLEGSNTEKYVRALSPKVAFMTGQFTLVPEKTYTTLAALQTQFYQADEVRQTGAVAFSVDLAKKVGSLPALYNTGNTASEPHLRTANEGEHHTWYYVNGLPTPHNGLVKEGDNWAYFENAAYSVQSKWIWQNNGWVYYDDKGLLEHNGWTFVQDTYGSHWYYFSNDGTMLKKQWIEDPVTHALFYVNDSGYMQQGWNWVEDAWRYFDPSNGALYSGWNTIGGDLYYLDPSNKGAMAKDGWVWIDNAWRYADSSGHIYHFGWSWIEDGWYYLDAKDNGRMYKGWQEIDGIWYYMLDNGKMQKGWQWIGWAWFYFNESGYMQSGWHWIDTAWYYLDVPGGALRQGWFWLDSDNAWYYSYVGGAMAHDCWIGNYWLTSSGVML